VKTIKQKHTSKKQEQRKSNKNLKINAIRVNYKTKQKTQQLSYSAT